MRIIVCGAGQVGGQIAKHLAREEGAYNVTVIDTDPALIRRMTDSYDINGIIGFASHPDVLEQAGARDADMLIAATRSDEVNMVVCQIAHSLFSVPRKIARLRAGAYLDAAYADLFRTNALPIDVVISPEHSVADAVLQRLTAPAAFDIEGFVDERVQLVGIALDAGCAVLDTPLRQLSELFSTLRAVVVGVRRSERLFVPQAEDALMVGDQVYLLTVTEDLARVMEIFGKPHLTVGKVLVIGGGNIGLHLAGKLETLPARPRLKVIERNRERAEAASEALLRSVVLHGDGLDRDLLEEADVAATDAVIAVTEDDKTNILACVRARSEGAKLVVALVNDPSLIELIGPMGIDAYVNPRSTTVSSILRYIRHGRIRAVYSVAEGEAEVIEAQVLGTSAIAGKLVREAEVPRDVRIGLMLKGDRLIVPKGETRIEEGDVLTLFAKRDRVAEVERLFRVGLDFF